MIAKPAKQKTEFSDGEAIKMLAPEIRRLIADGYSFADIAGMVAEVDASISPSSIAACLRSVSKVSGNKTKGAKETGKLLVAKRNERRTSIPPSEAVAITPATHIEENARLLSVTSDITAVVADTVPAQKPELDNDAPEIKKDEANAPDAMVAVENAHCESNESLLPSNKDQVTESAEWDLESE